MSIVAVQLEVMAETVGFHGAREVSFGEVTESVLSFLAAAHGAKRTCVPIVRDDGKVIAVDTVEVTVKGVRFVAALRRIATSDDVRHWNVRMAHAA
jgi:hypothetical protein